MHRSDRIYLSKFALDPDPDYLDLDDFDFDYGEYDDAFYDEISPGHEKNLAQETMRPINRPIKIEGQGI